MWLRRKQKKQEDVAKTDSPIISAPLPPSRVHGSILSSSYYSQPFFSYTPQPSMMVVDSLCSAQAINSSITIRALLSSHLSQSGDFAKIPICYPFATFHPMSFIPSNIFSSPSALTALLSSSASQPLRPMYVHALSSPFIPWGFFTSSWFFWFAQSHRIRWVLKKKILQEHMSFILEKFTDNEAMYAKAIS